MLIKLLADAKFDRILSSPYVRCMQTVVPIAGARGLPLEPVEALGEGEPLGDALELVQKHAISGALLCLHGDLMPMLLDHYASSGVEMTDELRWPKGCTWVLETDATGEVVPERYCARVGLNFGSHRADRVRESGTELPGSTGSCTPRGPGWQRRHAVVVPATRYGVVFYPFTFTGVCGRLCSLTRRLSGSAVSAGAPDRAIPRLQKPGSPEHDVPVLSPTTASGAAACSASGSVWGRAAF